MRKQINALAKVYEDVLKGYNADKYLKDNKGLLIGDRVYFVQNLKLRSNYTQNNDSITLGVQEKVLKLKKTTKDVSIWIQKGTIGTYVGKDPINNDFIFNLSYKGKSCKNIPLGSLSSYIYGFIEIEPKSKPRSWEW